MIVVIRIGGLVQIPQDMEHSLFRMRLRRKFSATILEDNEANRALLQKVRNHVAYGVIDKSTLVDLLIKRGKTITNKKISKMDAERIIEQLDKKSLKELGIKPFFRLHPPRGGIESKKHAGKDKGVLGDNKEKINELVRRML